MLSLMLCASFGLTSCHMDPDDEIGYDISGHWFGDLDMYYGNEKARGSEVTFTSRGLGWNKGTGVEVDYYRRGTITHTFDWFVENGDIIMLFDDRDLDCVIREYRLSKTFFEGYMDSYDNWTGKVYDGTYFRLRSYDYYWDEYGYSDYYTGRYYAPATRADSTAVENADGAEAKEIRGCNRKNK